MKHKIWATDDWMGFYTDYKTDSPAMDGNEVYELSWQDNMNQLEDEKANLSSVRGKNWFAVGKLQLWNGSRNVFRALKPGSIMDAACETMSAFNGPDDSFEIYVENGDVYISQLGHDNPTNASIMRIRQIKDDLLTDDMDVEDVMWQAIANETIDDVTIGFGDQVAAVYGWELEQEASL